MRIRMTILALTLLGLAGGTPATAARSGHHGGHGGHHGMGGGLAHGSAFAGGQQHANDSYVNAAAQEEDKLLDTKIKSICRGC